MMTPIVVAHLSVYTLPFDESKYQTHEAMIDDISSLAKVNPAHE
jgi:hypothetical protein